MTCLREVRRTTRPKSHRRVMLVVCLIVLAGCTWVEPRATSVPPAATPAPRTAVTATPAAATEPPAPTAAPTEAAPAAPFSLEASAQQFDARGTFQVGLGDLDLFVGSLSGRPEIWFNALGIWFRLY